MFELIIDSNSQGYAVWIAILKGFRGRNGGFNSLLWEVQWGMMILIRNPLEDGRSFIMVRGTCLMTSLQLVGLLTSCCF